MKNFSFIIEKLKLNKKRPLLRSLSLMLATVMVFSVAVWAWFSLRKDANADGIQMTVAAGKNLDISLDYGKTFYHSIDLLAAEHQERIDPQNQIKDKLYMYDITSDGDTFWSPKFKETTNGVRTPDTSLAWTSAARNIAYISETIVFRTTFPAEIYMGKNTTINTSVSTLTGANAGNKSDAGDFSKDCIVGALRISAIDVEEQNKLCFVCIPRSDVELVEDADGNFSVKTGSSVSADAKKHTYYPDSYTNGTTTNSNPLYGFTAVYDEPAPNDSTKITTTKDGGDGYYYGTAIVNIWLEGCDAETRRVLSGGKYNINLDFVAYEITETTEATN